MAIKVTYETFYFACLNGKLLTGYMKINAPTAERALKHLLERREENDMRHFYRVESEQELIDEGVECTDVITITLPQNELTSKSH